jgi:hypothetical protein
MTKKEEIRDPWDVDVDPKEVEKFNESNKGGGSGLLCPKRNRSINKRCHVCEAVQALWKTGDKHDEEVAREKGAKWEFYVNAVFPHNKDKSVIVRLGKKLGDALDEGMKVKGWTDIINPKANKGREVRITKSQGKNKIDTSYSIDPILNKADWDVPKEVLENMPNISDDIIGVISSAKPEDIFDVRSMKGGESIVIRILPWGVNSINHVPNVPVFRHYGVSQDEIDGVIPMSKTLAKTKEEGKETTEEKPPWEEEPQKEKVEEKKEDKP